MKLCAIGWHAFAKWGPVTSHVMTLHGETNPILHGGTRIFERSIPVTIYRQERICEKCGKIERREIKNG